MYGQKVFCLPVNLNKLGIKYQSYPKLRIINRIKYTFESALLMN